MSLPAGINALVTARVLTIEPWTDPVVEAVGYPLRDPYVEIFFGSHLGPTSILLLRRVGLGFGLHPEGFVLDVAETAAALGLGAGLGRNSPWWRTVGRLARFGLAHGRGPQTLAVRRAVAPLTQSQVDRLPASLQRAHVVAVSHRTPGSSARSA
jgi:hypothetical protein